MVKYESAKFSFVDLHREELQQVFIILEGSRELVQQLVEAIQELDEDR